MSDTEKATQSSQPDRYSVAEWKERASWIGPDVTDHIIAGALSTHEREHWTENQVRQAVKDFLDPKKTPGSEPLGDDRESDQ